jgi:predicted ABC-type ATPase
LNPSRPKLLIVAGANGAGKSTLTRRWSRRFQNRLGPVLDPDEIAKNLNPLNPPLASIRAARTVLGSTSKFLNQGSSFVIETTLSDRNRHLDLIEQAHVQGFRVWLLYVGLEKSGLHLNRVADRVRGGGQDVPDVDILRRLSRSLGKIFLKPCVALIALCCTTIRAVRCVSWRAFNRALREGPQV